MTNRARFNQPEEPQDAAGFNEMGNRYSRNGVYEQAIESYSKAIEMEATFAEAYFNRGVSHYEMGLYDEAIDDLTRAIDLNPTDDNYYGRRALVYLFNDQLDLAQADQDKCDELRQMS